MSKMSTYCVAEMLTEVSMLTSYLQIVLSHNIILYLKRYKIMTVKQVISLGYDTHKKIYPQF